VRRWVLVMVALLGMSACSGNDGAGTEEKKGASALKATVRNDPPGVIDARNTECSFDGDRQYTARGVVENAGDTFHHVQISVRFVDAEGVRVDLASDSVTDLQPGEAARWDASIYNDDGGVAACEVSTKAS
jgi:hypothetical protein